MSEKPRNGDRLPPHDAEAEAALLGAVLQDAGVMELIGQAGATELWCYDLRHQMILKHCLEMHRHQRPIDLVTLAGRLDVANETEKVGGLAYLMSLPEKAPSAANAASYLGIVREKYLARRAIQLCTEVVTQAYAKDGDGIEAELGRVALDLTTLAENVTQANERPVKVFVQQAVADLESHYTRGKLNIPPGNLPTGFEYLDKVMGGLAREDFMVLAGRPGAGKTTFMCDWLINLAASVKWYEDMGEAAGEERWQERLGNAPVGVFSLEMSGKALARRLLFRVAERSAGKFKQGFAAKDDFEALSRSSVKVSGLPVYIDDAPGQTVGQIAAKARRWARTYGIKCFMLDYLQLVSTGKRMENRNRELEEVVNTIMVLKKSLRIPWVVLAQMNRDIEKAESHRAPQLSDLKDCGAIEQAADHVFFLYLPARGQVRVDKQGFEHPDERKREDEAVVEAYPEMEHTERPIRVNGYEAKNRDGATGIVKFLFHRNQFRFEDWRNWATAHGFSAYGAGERKGANPSEG